MTGVLQLYWKTILDPNINQIYIHILLKRYYREILGILDKVVHLTLPFETKTIKGKNVLLQDRMLVSVGHFYDTCRCFKNSIF